MIAAAYQLTHDFDAANELAHKALRQACIYHRVICGGF